jgi:hypothetical protein
MTTRKGTSDAVGHDHFPGTVTLIVSGVFVLWMVIPDDPLRLASWDVLLISGILALILGLRQARQVSVKFDHTLRRLMHRGTLQGSPEAHQQMRRRLEASVRGWTRGVAWGGAVAIFGAFVIVMLWAHSMAKLPLAIFETYWAYVAGWQLGRMVAYGFLGTLSRKAGLSVRVIPGHLDGAAGLKPLGDFFFFQSMVTAIVALYLAIWWLLIPIWPRDYSSWRGPYVGLLAVSVVVEVLAFFAPMWFFHVAMRKEKEQLLQTADELSEQVAALEVELARPSQSQPRNELQERLSLMTKQYWAIEQMPTWPVDYKTKKHFTVSNAALVLPLLSEAAGLAGPWQHIIDTLGKIFGQT